MARTKVRAWPKYYDFKRERLSESQFKLTITSTNEWNKQRYSYLDDTVRRPSPTKMCYFLSIFSEAIEDHITMDEEFEWDETVFNSYMTIKMINVHRIDQEVGPICSSYIVTLAPSLHYACESLIEAYLPEHYYEDEDSQKTQRIDKDIILILWPALQKCSGFLDLDVIIQKDYEHTTKRRKLK